MLEKKQVDKTHYEFSRYMNKSRWASVWHQLDEVIRLNPSNVLEIGPGPGVFKQMATLFGLRVETLDLDPDLKPDYVGSATAMPFADTSYDVVCAFQVLEHVPYEKSLEIFSEMARVARKGVIISLPDAATRWPIAIHIPRLGIKWLSIPKPRLGLPDHLPDPEHYWEINKAGYSLVRLQDDLDRIGSMELANTYRVDENPYHRFFIFKQKNNNG